MMCNRGEPFPPTQDSNSIPLPGGTVFVHQKPCRYTPSPPNTRRHSAFASSLHSHVRRFMLQRDRQAQQVVFGS